jgi:NADH-quinone oxidoreductase subunit L
LTAIHFDTQPALLTCALLVLLLPLLSFVLSFLTAEKYSWLVSMNAPLLLLVSMLCSFFVLAECWNAGDLQIRLDWFNIGTTTITANLMLTRMSALMLSVVASISFIVHVYSIGYMAGDQHVRKYFALLGFFTFSMQGIVLADNLLLLFVFWELVGFSSYLLIGHWTDKPAAGRAARKAFLYNRIGDACFLIGLMIIWTQSGTFELSAFSVIGKDSSWQTMASLCLFAGVIGKSAQFPLFTWLPDAMEGPTPVSALIHAATMVAAGVYLLMRTFPMFTPDSLMAVAITGAFTAIIGAVAALNQFDIKKILAYSTISQLGLMIMAIGLGLVDAAMLHLLTHAFFKACLFLSAGSVIHSLHQAQIRATRHINVQDIRHMGGLRKKLPVTFFSFVLAAASLAGIPFFSGFLSKEAILASAWMADRILAWPMIIAMTSVSFITVLYIFRLVWFVFLGNERHALLQSVREAPWVMAGPASLLAVASLWFTVSWNPFDYTGWLFSARHHSHTIGITIFSVLWVGIALAVSYFIFRKTPLHDKEENTKSRVDLFYQRSFGSLTLAGAQAVSYIDKKWIDGLLHAGAYTHVTLAHFVSWIDRSVIDGIVTGLARVVSALGSFSRSFQSGKIQLYIFWAILTIIIFLIWSLN